MFFLPLFDNNPTVARPFVTWIIMALCVSGFIWLESHDYRTAHNIVYQVARTRLMAAKTDCSNLPTF